MLLQRHRVNNYLTVLSKICSKLCISSDERLLHLSLLSSRSDYMPLTLRMWAIYRQTPLKLCVGAMTQASSLSSSRGNA